MLIRGGRVTAQENVRAERPKVPGLRDGILGRVRCRSVFFRFRLRRHPHRFEKVPEAELGGEVRRRGVELRYQVCQAAGEGAGELRRIGGDVGRLFFFDRPVNNPHPEGCSVRRANDAGGHPELVAVLLLQRPKALVPGHQVPGAAVPGNAGDITELA